MIIHTLPSGPFDTNAYVISDSEEQKALIIDPGVESSRRIVDYLKKNNLSPLAILLTHSHWDHIAEVAPLKKQLSLPVYIHSEDVPNLEQPGADRLPCWVPIEGVKPDHLFHDGEQMIIGPFSFEIIHTPGHTPGGVCLWFKKEHLLFSGDTLFQGTIGNLSFPTSFHDRMWSSLKKLALLPSDTIVYPGHGLSTTIEAEKAMLIDAERLFS